MKYTPYFTLFMGIIANFEKLRDAWKNFDIVQEVSDIAAVHEKEIADLNRQQLYEKGEDSTGRKLKKYKRPRYARVKHEMNPKPGYGNPDFFLTGEFQKSIFADVRDRSIIMDAADPKVEFLVNRDGEVIFGLQDESRNTAWANILRPPLIPVLKNRTGAK